MNRLSLSPQLSTFYNRKLSFTANSFYWSNSLWRNKSAPQTVSNIKQTFTPALLRVFRTLFSYFITKSQVFVSQEVLAKETGVSLSTVRRFFKVAINHDIVDIEHNYKQENGFYYSNRIRLNAHFLKQEILHLLKSLFINMRWGIFYLKSLVSRKEALVANEHIEELNVNLIKTNCTVTEKLSVTGARGAAQFLKKEEAMNNDSLKLIQGNLDKLPLTTRGILKLAVLPVQAVQYILKTGVNFKANDIFLYMWGTGKKKAMELGLNNFNFTIYDQQCIELNLKNEPYIDADKLQELKSQQRETVKPVYKAYANQKQFAGSLGSPAAEPDFSEHRNWENEQKRLEMQKYCEIVEILGDRLPLAAKEKYDVFKKLLAVHPVAESAIPGNQTKTKEELTTLEKIAKKVSVLGINPEGLTYWQMNESLRGNCFCCIITRTNGKNPKCTQPNCFLIDKKQPAQQPIIVEQQPKETVLSDNFMQSYVESDIEPSDMPINANLLFDM